MMILKKMLPRRTFLRGIGATLALPLLDAMVPAMGSARAAAAPLTRFGFVYVPHGVILDKFIPAAEGPDFEFKPIMKPVESFRNQLTVLSNIMGPPDGGGGHSGAAAMWLNGETPKKTEAEDVRAGMTVDQIIAKKRGSDTMYPSLELATEDLTGLIGSCDTGFSCTYINTLSWATPTTPLPMEINPRVVFERMFGDGGTRAQRLARSREDQSILDSIKADAGRLSRGRGTGDQKRVADYLENVREIERRIQSAEKQAESSIMLPDAPVGVPDDYDEHVALMFDLMTIAYQTDITRVATFMMARELSNRTYPQVGVADPHHSISHHQNNTAIMDKHATVNTHHMTLFAKFLDTLKNTPDGDGSLLDHSMIVYGSGMANGNIHSHDPLWLMTFGGANGKLKGNRHIKVADKTPLGNALLALAEVADVELDKIGQSTDKKVSLL